MKLLPDSPRDSFHVQAQSRTNYTLEVFAVGDLLCIATPEEAIYLNREQVKKFYDLQDKK